MKTLALFISLISAIALSAWLTGCSDAKAASTPGAITGAPCKIQLKRDMLGGNTNHPIGVETDRINGADVSVNGTFKRFNEDWIVLSDDKGEIWVPRNVVLMVKFFQK